MTAPRRTLSDNLTRAQRAFLTVADKPDSLSEEPLGETADSAIEAQPSKPRSAFVSRIAKALPTESSSNRPESLRSVTIRLHASVADALRRESIKRSLDYIEPFSQQAIVEAAVCGWLKSHSRQGDD